MLSKYVGSFFPRSICWVHGRVIYLVPGIMRFIHFQCVGRGTLDLGRGAPLGKSIEIKTLLVCISLQEINAFSWSIISSMTFKGSILGRLWCLRCRWSWIKDFRWTFTSLECCIFNRFFAIDHFSHPLASFDRLILSSMHTRKHLNDFNSCFLESCSLGAFLRPIRMTRVLRSWTWSFYWKCELESFDNPVMFWMCLGLSLIHHTWWVKQLATL